MKKRNIGIVGNGPTDRSFFGKVAECIISKSGSDNTSFNIIPLNRHNLHDDVDRYWEEADKTNEHYLPSKPALKLQAAVTGMLTAAFSDFESEIGIGSLSCHDVLLVTTDTEKTLSTPETYFKTWAFSFSKILMGAIQTFYSMMAKNRYYPEYLPLIISVATFPSTEILVGAARGQHNECYGKTPKELKRRLYATEDILSEEQFKEKALDRITAESIDLIFRHVPESRIFIQTLLALGRSN